MNSTQGRLTLGIEPQFDVVPLHATLPARVDGIDKLELQIRIVLELKGTDLDELPVASVIGDASILEGLVLE